MIQLQQDKLMATGCLLTSIQLNYLLTNDEVEAGLNADSEELGK